MSSAGETCARNCRCAFSWERCASGLLTMRSTRARFYDGQASTRSCDESENCCHFHLLSWYLATMWIIMKIFCGKKNIHINLIGRSKPNRSRWIWEQFPTVIMSFLFVRLALLDLLCKWLWKTLTLVAFVNCSKSVWYKKQGSFSSKMKWVSALLLVALLPSPHLSVLPREEQLTWAKQGGDPVLATHNLLGEQAHSPRRRRASPCPPPAGVFLDPRTGKSTT